MVAGAQIIYEIEETGAIQITPYDRKNVNPNSYNFHLGNTLTVYNICENMCDSSCPHYDPAKVVAPGRIRDCASGMVSFIDPRKETPSTKFEIPTTGYILEPGKLYLANTVESTASTAYVVSLDGRSSLARYGISIHVTAGFGDYGFSGKWTLEITVSHPVIVYPGMSFGQFYFEELTGVRTMRYAGKYMGSDDTVTSRYHLEGQPTISDL